MRWRRAPDGSDNRVARELLAGLAPLLPRMELVWADGAYAGEKLRKWCEEWTGWRLEVVQRSAESSTFEVLPRRWIVERSIGWICRNRRLAKDYERKMQTSSELCPAWPGFDLTPPETSEPKDRKTFPHGDRPFCRPPQS